jgi:hypothetical protein
MITISLLDFEKIVRKEATEGGTINLVHGKQRRTIPLRGLMIVFGFLEHCAKLNTTCNTC